MRRALFALSLTLLAVCSASATDLNAVFVPAGDLSEASNVVSGVSLPDGRALFAGGWQGEVYNPATGGWEDPILFQGNHFMGTTVLLADGRALIVGTPSTSPTAVYAETFDPTTGQVARTGPGLLNRYGAALMTAADGSVVVWAGFAAGTSWPPVATSERFDPASNTFRPLSVPVPARWDAAVVGLSDGRFLIAGGSTADQNVQQQAVLYSPSTNTAVATGSQPGFYWAQTAVRLRDGRVLLCGGYNSFLGSVRTTADAQIYSPQNGSFTSIAPMMQARSGATAALLPDGRVLIVGGRDAWNTYLSNAEVFDPATQRFSLSDARPINARAGALALSIGGGRLVIAGGQDSHGPIRESEAFIPDSIMASSFD